MFTSAVGRRPYLNLTHANRRVTSVRSFRASAFAFASLLILPVRRQFHYLLVSPLFIEHGYPVSVYAIRLINWRLFLLAAVKGLQYQAT